MKQKHSKQNHLYQSTVFRLFAIIIVMVLPINVITLILVRSVVKNNEETMVLQAQNALEISMSNFSETLKKANRDLQYLSFDNTNVSRLEGNMEEYPYEERLQIVSAVTGELQDIAESYQEVDMAYFSVKSNGYDLTGGYSGINRDDCLAAIREISENTTRQYGTTWTAAKINGRMVLIGFNRWRGAEFGIIVNLGRVINQIALPKYEQEYTTFFSDLEGQIYSGTGEAFFEESGRTLSELRRGKEYHVYSVSEEKYGIQLVQIVKQKGMIANMSIATGMLELLAILLTALAIPMLLIYMKRWVVSPLNRLTNAIGRIEQGDLDYRIEEGNQGIEFEQINHSFNRMMEQVQELKIDVYERELEKKNITMRYLSQQIQPHFILNAMNILYSYEPEEYQLSQKMILCISKYFRYIVNANARFVTLEKEMAHIKNYFEIQKARFPGLFYSIVEYEEGLSNALIPPLLVQNFAENTIKHSLKIGNKITIFVVGEYLASSGGEKLMRIRMADTGKGIDDEILNEIETFKRTGVHQPHLGVGIENSIERLKYFYSDRTGIRFSRDEHYEGTNIEIILPIYFEERVQDEDITG